MRFQGVSPDSLSRFRSPSRTEDQIFSTYFTGVGDVEGGGGAPLQSKNNEAKLATGNGSGGGDMLLQWGQRKRSSRTENRHVVGVTTTDDSSSSSSTHFQGGVVKGNRRVVAVVEKQKKSVIGGHTMPPPAPSLNPCSTSNGGRAGNLKPPCPKDTIAFSPNWRSSEDRSGCVNGSPPSHSGRPISPRSRVGKRSPNTKEKTEMMNNNNSSKFSSKLKNGLNLSHHDDHNHQEGGEHDENNVKNGKDGGSDGVGVNVWPRIYIPLTRKEKEEDFLAMKGTKLPHRPKKRPKAVERLLQYVYPGMWLGDVTRARYEVKEKKSAKKQRRRGLKGMESMESDSD